jgi:hypothetical protein
MGDVRVDRGGRSLIPPNFNVLEPTPSTEKDRPALRAEFRSKIREEVLERLD